MGHHEMSADFRRPTRDLAAFPAEVRTWLRYLATRGEAVVTSYDEKGSTVILLAREGRPRELARWHTIELRVLSFGPPDKAVLVHDALTNVLSVRARPPTFRDLRLGRRADRVLQAGAAAPGWDPDTIYSLEPLERGTFNWEGNERIGGIVITRACLRVPGASEAYLTVSSGDVRRTLRDEIPQFALEGGELVQVRFRCTIEVDGEEVHVSFTVRPPSISDLPQKSHWEMIAEFLKEQGVIRA